MKTLHELHMEMVDAVNNAPTKEESTRRYFELFAWRKGVEAATGRQPDLMAADLEQFSRGHEDRSMCCGVFTEWTPPAA